MATAFGCAKWSIRSKRFAVLGCLKNELAGRSVEKLMDDKKKKKKDHSNIEGKMDSPGRLLYFSLPSARAAFF